MRELSNHITELIIRRLPLFIIAFLTLILVTLSISAVDSSIRALNERVISQSAAKINFIGATLSGQLSSLINLMRSEAASPLIRNAVADSEGLESYLRPHLRSTIDSHGAIVNIALFDAIGTEIVSLIADGQKPDQKIGREKLQIIIESGQPAYEMLDNATVLLTMPVWFPPTGRHEGALVAQIDLQHISRAALGSPDNSINGDHADLAFVAKEGTVDEKASQSTPYFPRGTLTTAIRFALPAPFSRHEAEVRYTASTIKERWIVIQTALVYVLAFTLAWVAFFILTEWVKRRYVEPIRQITAIAQKVARSRATIIYTSIEEESIALLQQSVQSVVEVLNNAESNHQEKIQLTFEELRNTRVQLENIARDGGIIAFSVDLESGLISYCTESLHQLLVTPKENPILWTEIYGLLNYRQRRLMHSAVTETIHHGKARFQIDLDGHHQQRTYDVRLRYIGSTGRRNAHIDCIAFDNTDKAALDLALAKSELRKAAIINGAIDGFVTLGPDFIITEINPAAERMLGRRNIELLGLRFSDHCIAPDSQHKFSKYCNAVIALEGASALVHEGPVWCRNAAGENLPVGMSASLVNTNTGLQICLYLKDLRKTHEQELAIARKNAEIEAIFSLNPDGFASFDENDQLSAYNESLCEMLDIVPGRLKKGMPNATFWEIISNLSHKTDDKTVVKMLNPDEQVIIVNAPKQRLIKYTRRFPNREGSKQPSIFYFRDVTQEFQLHAMKSQFLATAAHELRTPLTTILGFSEFLSTQEVSEQDHRELLDSIFRHSLNLSALINDLLDLAKIESEGLNILKLQKHDLRDILTNLFNSVSAPLDGKRFMDQHEFTLELGERAPLMALIDDDQIRRAIHNLLSNAAKYSAASMPITLSAHTVDNNGTKFVKIAVTDHGIGMTQDELEHAQLRFWRADSASGKTSGTGLGLSLVKEIVELHQGMINMESEYGVGTTVSIVLPLFDKTGQQEAAKG